MCIICIMPNKEYSLGLSFLTINTAKVQKRKKEKLKKEKEKRKEKRKGRERNK